MTTMLTLITDRPSLSLWTSVPGNSPAWSLSCPRCRRVFKVTDEQPLQLHGRRSQPRTPKGQEITIRGEIICPHGCGARFSVNRGQVQWRNAEEHRVA